MDQIANLLDDLRDQDIRGLARLTDEQRDAQLAARRELHRHVDHVWQSAKAEGTNPAMRPDWRSWAALRDLTAALVAHADHEHDLPKPES